MNMQPCEVYIKETGRDKDNAWFARVLARDGPGSCHVNQWRVPEAGIKGIILRRPRRRERPSQPANGTRAYVYGWKEGRKAFLWTFAHLVDALSIGAVTQNVTDDVRQGRTEMTNGDQEGATGVVVRYRCSSPNPS